MKLYLVSLFALVSGPIFGQLHPYYNQYILNQFIINPAVAGIEPYTDLKLSHRHQWVGFENAPVTTYLTMHGAIGKPDFGSNPTSLPVEGKNPRGSDYWRSYKSAPAHQGWGISITNDNTGIFNRLTAYASYAYHQPLTTNLTLAGGISFGLVNHSMNSSKLLFEVPGDPVVTANNSGSLQPDLNTGLWLYGRRFFVGLSAQQLLIKQSNNTGSKNGFSPFLFASTGYSVPIGESLSLIPSVVARYQPHLPLGMDFNAKLTYWERCWFGGGYRTHSGMYGMAGVYFANLMSVSYVYDYTTLNTANFNRSTHEVLIGFAFGNRYGDTCPRNVW